MVVIGEKEYPIRIDLNVMEEIEEEFGTVEKFKQKLLGFEYQRDADGELVIDDEGRPKIKPIAPSVKALKFILPLVVNEGIKYEAFEQRKPYEPLDTEYIIMACEMDRDFLLRTIFDEFERCERVKKNMPASATKSKRK